MLDFVMASIAFMLAVSTISYFFPGCTARGLSFSSKTFTKMLQSCPHQCDLHKVILEAEERYKKELRQLAVCNNSRYATHESNYDFFLVVVTIVLDLFQILNFFHLILMVCFCKLTHLI